MRRRRTRSPSADIGASIRCCVLALASMMAVTLAGCFDGQEPTALPTDPSPTTAKAYAVPIDATGSFDLAVCAYEVPTVARDGACTTINGANVLHNYKIEANMTRVNLTLAWTPTNLLGDRLAFTVGASECPTEGCSYVVFDVLAGTSPLEWFAADLKTLAPPGWTFFAHVRPDTVTDAPYPIALGTTQEFRVSGALVFSGDPTEGAEGSPEERGRA